jgi:hypothetical protein
MVKIEEGNRVAVHEYLVRFIFSKMYYILVYKKLLMPQLCVCYALLFYVSSYFIEETVMLQCYGVSG